MPERALAGQTVLVTRPGGEDDELVALLRAQGAHPLVAPTIAYAEPDDPEPANDCLRTLDRFEWCAFTSAQGARSFFERAGRLQACIPRGLQFACVGPKTAAVLADHGVHAALLPGRFIAHELAATLIERSSAAARILIYAAAEGSGVLPDILARERREVSCVAGYRTVVRRDPGIASHARRASVWTFASGSAVRGLMANVSDAATLSLSKTVACIGPSCAGVAEACGLAVSLCPSESTAQSLTASLASFFESAPV